MWSRIPAMSIRRAGLKSGNPCFNVLCPHRTQAAGRIPNLSQPLQQRVEDSRILV